MVVKLTVLLFTLVAVCASQTITGGDTYRRVTRRDVCKIPLGEHATSVAGECAQWCSAESASGCEAFDVETWEGKCLLLRFAPVAPDCLIIPIDVWQRV